MSLTSSNSNSKAFNCLRMFRLAADGENWAACKYKLKTAIKAKKLQSCFDVKIDDPEDDSQHIEINTSF